MILLGLDPGFANLGWATAIWDGRILSVTGMGCIQTRKDTRKVLAAIDEDRRTCELALAIRELIWSYTESEPVRIVDLICIEATSYPRNASSAAKVALCRGVISSLRALWDMPLIMSSPQNIKEAVTGSRKASKAQMEATLSGRYPEVLKHLEGTPMSRREHPYDALGAIVAALGSEVVRMGARKGAM